MEITLSWDSRKALNFLDDVRTKATKAALARSLTDTGRTLSAESNRRIRKHVTLKSKTVRENLYRKGKPSRSMPIDNMYVVVGAKSANIPLIDYQARQTKAGVSVKVMKQGKRSTIEGAFVATMKSGHKGVFVRKRMAVERGWKVPNNRKPSPRSGQKVVGKDQAFIWRELPIFELWSKRVSSAFQDQVPTLKPFAQATFDKRFAFWFGREMEKLSTK